MFQFEILIPAWLPRSSHGTESATILKLRQKLPPSTRWMLDGLFQSANGAKIAHHACGPHVLDVSGQ